MCLKGIQAHGRSCPSTAKLNSLWHSVQKASKPIQNDKTVFALLVVNSAKLAWSKLVNGPQIACAFSSLEAGPEDWATEYCCGLLSC